LQRSRQLFRLDPPVQGAPEQLLHVDPAQVGDQPSDPLPFLLVQVAVGEGCRQAGQGDLFLFVFRHVRRSCRERKDTS
jgi:hypothetical protein